MPFVRKLPEIGKSSATELNFLWRHESRPIYVMDNHLGALWCWLQELAEDEPYSMAHVDFHWDDAPCEATAAVLRLGPKPDLEALLAVRSPTATENGRAWPLVRWDNYLSLLPDLRPNAQSLFQVAHQMETHNPDVGFRSQSRSQSIDSLGPTADALAWEKTRQIINLDLDYFFVGSGKQRIFTDEFMDSVVRRFAEVVPQAIWTIAWSPECCGSWREAADVARLVDSVLKTDFPFQELGSLPSEADW